MERESDKGSLPTSDLQSNDLEKLIPTTVEELSEDPAVDRRNENLYLVDEQPAGIYRSYVGVGEIVWYKKKTDNDDDTSSVELENSDDDADDDEDELASKRIVPKRKMSATDEVPEKNPRLDDDWFSKL